MKTTILDIKQIPFVFCSIKERLAAIQLQEAHPAITITHVSDVEGYDSWDVIIKSGQTKQVYVTEIKVRKRFSDYSWFTREGVILEKIKYDTLTEATRTPKGIENNVKPLFVVFLFDCILLWDISNIQPEDFISREYRKTSVNGNTETTMKDVTYLQLQDAQRINFELNHEKLSSQAKTILN